jgi:hypothetical protein
VVRASKPIVHKSVALILCDSPAYLEEMLTELDMAEVPHQRVGGRALVIPEEFLAGVQEQLHGLGVYPAVVRGTGTSVP